MVQAQPGARQRGHALAWSIDPPAFSLFPNSVKHTATVRITANSTMAGRTFAFDANKALADIQGDSMALLAGQAGEVLLYGTGFDALAGGLGSVTVGGVQPSAVSKLSDNVMRVTLPTMAAGSFAVALNPGSLLTIGLVAPGNWQRKRLAPSTDMVSRSIRISIRMR